MLTYLKPNLIKKLQILLVLSCFSCLGAKQDLSALKNGELETPSSEILKTRLAVSIQAQTQGLSGIQEADFGDDEAMLFYYKSRGIRQFWMPDTYFNLDLFFLDETLTIIDIERNLAAHPGMQEPPAIPRSRSVMAHHVLEIKAASPIARKLKIGDQLKWKSQPSLDERGSKIRLLK